MALEEVVMRGRVNSVSLIGIASTVMVSMLAGVFSIIEYVPAPVCLQ